MDTALRSGKIISAADFALMTTSATLTDGKLDDYGFGWWIDPLLGHKHVYTTVTRTECRRVTTCFQTTILPSSSSKTKGETPPRKRLREYSKRWKGVHDDRSGIDSATATLRSRLTGN